MFIKAIRFKGSDPVNNNVVPHPRNQLHGLVIWFEKWLCQIGDLFKMTCNLETELALSLIDDYPDKC